VIVSQSDPEQVVYGGEVLGESIVDSEEQIGREVVHKYEVSEIF